MPIPVNNKIVTHETNECNTTTVQNVFIQVIHTILSSRVKIQGKQHQYCLEEHNVCCFSSSVVKEEDRSCCIVMNILQKESNILLERWMMSFDMMNNENQLIIQDDFIQNLTQFIRQMPAKTEFIDMYSIAFLNNNDRNQCYTHISTQERIEFKPDAHLKAQRFHLSSLLSLEVVFDENFSISKKPIISLQSLSNPLFMPWSKMQQQQQQQQQQQLQQNLQEIHPLASSPVTMTTTTTMATNQTNSSANHMPVPVIAVRRLSRLSLSAMQLDDDDEEDSQSEELSPESTSTTTNTSPSNTIPIPSSRMQYTHHGHRTTLAYSTSPNNNHLSFKSFSSSFSSLSPNSIFDIPSSYHPHSHSHQNQHQQVQQRRNSFTNEFHHGCLVGSFEESLLSGRMSSMPSKPITFHCQIGVLGHGDCKPSLKCPPHWSILFPAMFYKLGEEEEGSIPYVGTVDIGEHVNTVIKKPNQPGYRIPPKGQLQVVVKNPNKTAVKLFLIPYDFTDMPKNTKTFLRQKSYTIDTPQQLLRYAIHIQVCRTEKKRIYLYKSMRIVFANRKADAREKFKVICEGPKEPSYMPL